ncbi:conserved hypothetical protein [Leishmania major strain Friedlin]|uniref:Leucine-rich repeat protein n=1 Tax=Leishmania major TaxID=5664 RepID=Q4Q2L3_LEIMA|nr:conserved hypothetical protein [Leishmania major strain Friedlin]CAG9582208.1 hypothetical_protein_-_conserved [Leishmania major strain Friedlin]CAJ08052.1 conserved hypothetical protein [Leishmania major strain Friedlin]|eukprot:XP_001686435.1 conserved hypothetical protein [Leishmania major strain Friedlin]
MDAFRSAKLTCHTTLAPSIAREENEHVLRIFNAPAQCAEREAESRLHRFHGRAGFLRRQHESAIGFHPLRFLERMSTEAMTDTDAEKMAYAMRTHSTSFEQLLRFLIAKLRETVPGVSWNRPQAHQEWDSDLRFYGPWWLVVRSKRHLRQPHGSTRSILTQSTSASSTAKARRSVSAAPRSDLLFLVHEGKPENQYTPLLVEQSIAAENQLIADIALRLGGHTFQLNLFHLSGVFLGPDRMHVLVFDGFRRLCAGTATATATASAMQPDFMDDEDSLLSTLSLSSCHIASAGLLILLTGIVYLSKHHNCHVHSLDLSYNELTSNSLWCLIQTLPFTKIRRFSLRGNVLTSRDPSTLCELLSDGCSREIEELDLSYTALSAAQTSALIDYLPRLLKLRVLLLEEVPVPSAKWPAFALAVAKTHLLRVQLFAGPPSSAMAGYAKTIEEMCLRNRQRAMECCGGEALRKGMKTYFGLKNASFFQEFFQVSLLRGGLAFGETTAALPDGYGVFSDNDPSLHVGDALE